MLPEFRNDRERLENEEREQIEALKKKFEAVPEGAERDQIKQEFQKRLRGFTDLLIGSASRES